MTGGKKSAMGYTGVDMSQSMVDAAKVMAESRLPSAALYVMKED